MVNKKHSGSEKPNWTDTIGILSGILESMSITDRSGVLLDQQDGINQWIDLTLSVRKMQRTIYFVGNGASASMASHFATDVAKNAGIRTNVFTDQSLITAIANDFCYEEVYAEPLRWYMNRGDMLIAVSSSGNSPNIVRAIETAKSISGSVITLSGMSKTNVIIQLGDLNFHFPAGTYGMAETAHATLLHYWMDAIERK